MNSSKKKKFQHAESITRVSKMQGIRSFSASKQQIQHFFELSFCL